MRRWSLLLLLVCLSSAVQAQEFRFSYSPRSVRVWGQTPKMERLELAYTQQYARSGDFEFQAELRTDFFWAHKLFVDQLDARTHHQFNSVAFCPLGIHWRKNDWVLGFALGLNWFNRPFPTDNGRRSNVLFELTLRRTVGIVDLGFSYTHISNAWTGRLNPGIDSPAFTLAIHLPPLFRKKTR